MKIEHTTDVIIIGAGPVGLFAVFECGMLKMGCHVIDSLEEIGGQCTALYPEKPIYDIPALPKVKAADLINQLSEQISPFTPAFHLGQQVVSIDRQDDFWVVGTSKNTTIKGKAIIIAAGVGAFGPNRPPLEGIEPYEGESVFYLIRNPEQFKNKKLMIAGGGDSAVDWALALSEIAAEVHVVHRRDKFRAAPDNVEKLKALAKSGKVQLHIPYHLKSLMGKDKKLSGVTLATLDGDEKYVEVDTLFPFFGLSMQLGPIAEWGLDLEKKHLKVEPSTMATNLEGIYAIGDIATYPGKLKLIMTGFSESAIAAHDIYNLVYPNKELHFEYSTTKFADTKA